MHGALSAAALQPVDGAVDRLSEIALGPAMANAMANAAAVHTSLAYARLAPPG